MLTTLPPILISLTRRLVSDRGSAVLGIIGPKNTVPIRGMRDRCFVRRIRALTEPEHYADTKFPTRKPAGELDQQEVSLPPLKSLPPESWSEL